MDEFMSRSEIVVSGGTTTATNRHFLANHLGSVLALTDAAGAITKNYKYEPYGKVTTTGETSANPYQYTGRENDIAASGTNPTGLYFYRARYYDATMQRFVSEDPIGLRGGRNVYRYVNSEPIFHNDPTGLAPGQNPPRKKPPRPPFPNGNIDDGFTQQDYICSYGGGLANNDGCVRDCCVKHDDCYWLYECNASSWNGPSGSVCQGCNSVFQKCLSMAGPCDRCGNSTRTGGGPSPPPAP
jgi:RHS repeat-associated protein